MRHSSGFLWVRHDVAGENLKCLNPGLGDVAIFCLVRAHDELDQVLRSVGVVQQRRQRTPSISVEKVVAYEH